MDAGSEEGGGLAEEGAADQRPVFPPILQRRCLGVFF